MEPAGFALKNAKAILFFTVVLALLGVRASFIAPASVFPTMTFSRVDVVVEVGDLPPDQVRAAVTVPLEQAMQALPYVAEVRSASAQGSAEAIVDFAPATDPRGDLQYVDQALSQLRASLPPGANANAVVVNPASEPVLSYALTSRSLSPALLREFATYTVLPKLYGVPGLGRLLVIGGPQIEYHVDLDPAALTANRVGPGEIAKALADVNTIRAVGVADHAAQRYALVVDSSLGDARTLGAVRIPTRNAASVPLAALGAIRLAVAPSTNHASYDARPAVLINAYQLPGADVVKLGAAIKDRLAALAPAVPRVVSIAPYWDQTTFIVNSQHALRDSIFLGALIAIVVIFAFLRSVRLTLVAAAVIPVAMAIAIFALQQAGETLNLMSVGGLAVAVGLIIDDAIVVIEAVARVRAERPEMPIREAVGAAMRPLAPAMIASTSATVVVFVPLALLTGVAGFFFRALAFTLASSLVVSLALALFVAPILAATVLRGANDAPHSTFVDGLHERYGRVLRFALARRALTGGLAAATLLATYLLMSRLPSEFLPYTDEGKFEITYRMPTGIDLAASDAAATAMERVVISDPAVASVGRLTAIDTNGYSPTPANVGLLRVTLLDPGKRAGYDAVSARLRDRLATTIPSATLDFKQILEDQLNGLSGVAAPLEVDLHGADQATLVRLAGQVAQAVGRVPGVVDVSPGITYENPTLRIAPNGARLAALGLGAVDLADALAARTQGTIVTSVPGTHRLVPVRVRVADVRSPLDPQGPTYVKGDPSALQSLASLKVARLATEIDAQNGTLVARVTANLGGGSLSGAVAGMRAALRSVVLPPGYTAEITGQAQTQAQSFGEFANVIAVAVALVFAILLATFKSYRLPIVILAAVPMALIGVAVALSLTRTPLDVSSFMGVLLLVGIVVKNGILLLDVAHRRIREGARVAEALADAGAERLRPIVMTTLAAIGGLVPLAIGLGQGAELERPLAIAVIGGLSTATVFTLVVIPVFFAVLMPDRPAPGVAS